MRIKMLVNGDTSQEYTLERGKQILETLSQKNILIDDETKQLAKIEFLKEDSKITVIPKVYGG